MEKNFSEMSVDYIHAEWEMFKKIRAYDSSFSKLERHYFTVNDREKLIDELLKRLKYVQILEETEEAKSLIEFDEVLIFCLQENVKKFKGLAFEDADSHPLFKKYEDELLKILDYSNELGIE